MQIIKIRIRIQFHHLYNSDSQLFEFPSFVKASSFKIADLIGKNSVPRRKGFVRFSQIEPIRSSSLMLDTLDERIDLNLLYFKLLTHIYPLIFNQMKEKRAK